MFHADFSYDSCGRIQIARHRVLEQENVKIAHSVVDFRYDDDGQLLGMMINDGDEYNYQYDADGNMLMSSTRRGKSGNKNEYKFNDRGQVLDFRKKQISQFFGTYDHYGRMVINRNRNYYKYSSNNLLLEVQTDKFTVKYFYDHMNRLIGRKDSTGDSIQFFYAYPTKPHLVSHIFRSKESSLTTLLYNDDDKLFFARVGSQSYYIISDQVGSPFLFFTPMGDLVRQISRQPYGEVILDSNPLMEIPIGFGGAIYDADVELLHFQVISENNFLFFPAPNSLKTSSRIHEINAKLFYL